MPAVTSKTVASFGTIVFPNRHPPVGGVLLVPDRRSRYRCRVTEVRQVLVLYTGGTIGMEQSERGYRPAAGFLEQQLRRLPQFCDPTQPPLTTPVTRFGHRIRVEIREYAPILDSSSMAVDDWVRIAQDVARWHDHFDGFVVLHGTDTMAYTASALSFMLEALRKPVILTGSQVPLFELRNDAVDNFLDALTLAGTLDIPEVCVAFHHRLHRGNRVQKVDATGFDAFRSGNFPPLVEIGIDTLIHWERVRPQPEAPFRVRPITQRGVAALRLYPGLGTQVVENFVRPPLSGLVLETYGAGNAPESKELLSVLERASNRGVVVVNVSQCHRARVRPAYASGRALADAGVVGGEDMTPEAALTKLSWLLSLNLTPDGVRGQVGRDLRGELTPPTPTRRHP